MTQSNYGFKSLTDAQCDDIYKSVQGGSATRKEVALIYGISDRTVGRVIQKLNELNLSGASTDSAQDCTKISELPQYATADVVCVSTSVPKTVIDDYDIVHGADSSEFMANTDGLSITIVWNGQPKVVTRKESHFDMVKTTLFDKGPKDAYLLLVDKKQTIDVAFGKNNPHIRYEKGEVYYKQVKLDYDTVVTAIRKYAGQGDATAVDRLLNFLDKLIENPSESAVKMLYKFIQHNNIELTDDGDIIAFKKVRADFKDIHSGTMDNSVGNVVKMDRRNVVENPNDTCSAGLHACSWAYLQDSGFGNSTSSKYVKLKINPRDVVSVPNDYNGTKMRCCEYQVIGLIG